MNNKIFLGGTCAGSTWRDKVIPQLVTNYFNPVVEDWTKECQQIEIEEKQNKCNIHLYVISKEMKGVFSIAEAVHSVHDKDVHTIFHIIPQGFKKAPLKSLMAVAVLIETEGGSVSVNNDLTNLITKLNNYE